jgi:hypothetical protein
MELFSLEIFTCSRYALSTLDYVPINLTMWVVILKMGYRLPS